MKAIFVTNTGIIKIKLFTELVPYSCCKFIELIVDKNYVGTVFNRVIKGFMIQGGDTSVITKLFQDEVNTSLIFSKPFRVAFANSGINTNRTQFFITTVPTPHLNGKYTQIGEVIEGIEIVKLIENVEVENSIPKIKQIILDTYLEK